MRQSSTIKNYKFQIEEQFGIQPVLTIEFQSGSSYRYFGVPVSVVDGMEVAESVGTYFSQNIRNDYEYEKV